MTFESLTCKMDMKYMALFQKYSDQGVNTYHYLSPENWKNIECFNSIKFSLNIIWISFLFLFYNIEFVL